MRVLLLRSLGGHPARTVVDQDQAAAEWLLSTGLAVTAPDADPEPDDPAEPEITEPTGPAEVEPAATAEPVTSESARRGRRPSRTATPGG
ncbi:hypothetical protein OG439_16550 [Amycolatopsis sp. NBC_01307]|uniref:hypothetical protein n=1 Tax=Amycolatopsis sp. NBC_01307 TaxID=2903561 RepID=UPI002E149BE5|nr:hypothetical protein OG439_16550 [Amycolatopsis sp. NBC_01307]